ncbi:MAG: hypothetical protein WD757_07945 [Actinomycetota bacterium]
MAERRSGVGAALLAVGGIALGHIASYSLAIPAADARETHLAATGHGSFGLVSAAAVVAALAGLAVVVKTTMSHAGSLGFRACAVRLAGIQAPGFLLLELAERRFAFVEAVGDPAVIVGFLVQVLVALAGAAFLTLLVRTVEAIVAPRRRHPRAARSFPKAGRTVPIRISAFLGGSRLRAPPLPLAS